MKVNGKKIWSVTWKTLIGIILLFLVIGGGIALDEYFHSWEFRHRHGSDSVDKYYPANSSAFMIEEKWGEYFRTINAATGEKITPKLQYIYNGFVSDTLTVFEDKNGMRGYLNAYTGEIAIPAQFEHAWIFSEGVGAVVKNGKLGFIDHQGNWAIQPRFRYADENVEYVFHNGLCMVKDSCGIFGLIDLEGNYVLESEYTLIRCTRNNCRLVQKGSFDGLYCDSTRQMVLECVYDNILFNDEGITLTRSGRKWMVSHDLKTVIYPFLFDSQNTFTVYLDEEDEYGNRKHYEYQPIGFYEIRYQYGLLDRRTGLPITPAIYSGIQFVTPNLFDCELAGGCVDDHVFINANGEIVQ